MIEDPTPTSAYDFLEVNEREAVDSYIEFIKEHQKERGERIALALKYPIPSDQVKRSRGVLARPLVRAAVAEKIQDLADEEDLNPSRVIREYAGIAFSNIGDFLQPSDFGDVTLKDIRDIPRDKMASVKTFKSKPTLHGNSVEVVMHDKLSALKVMAELMGLVAPDEAPILEDYTRDKTEEETNDTSEEAYAKRLERL